MDVQVSLQYNVKSFGYDPRDSIAGSYDSQLIKFKKNADKFPVWKKTVISSFLNRFLLPKQNTRD